MIVNVEATPARLAQEIIATKVMLERVEEAHHLRPERLAADRLTAQARSWAGYRNVRSSLIFPMLDRQHQTDGLLPREVFTFDPEKNHYSCPQNKISQALYDSCRLPDPHLSCSPADCKSSSIRQQCTRSTQRSMKSSKNCFKRRSFSTASNPLSLLNGATPTQGCDLFPIHGSEFWRLGYHAADQDRSYAGN